MNKNYTAVIKKDLNWWIGWIEEIPGVNCQESSRADLLTSLKLTLQEALEFNRQDAIAAAGGKLSRRTCGCMKRNQFLQHLHSNGLRTFEKVKDILGGIIRC